MYWSLGRSCGAITSSVLAKLWAIPASCCLFAWVLGSIFEMVTQVLVRDWRVDKDDFAPEQRLAYTLVSCEYLNTVDTVGKSGAIITSGN